MGRASVLKRRVYRYVRCVNHSHILSACLENVLRSAAQFFVADAAYNVTSSTRCRLVHGWAAVAAQYSMYE